MMARVFTHVVVAESALAATKYCIEFGFCVDQGPVVRHHYCFVVLCLHGPGIVLQLIEKYSRVQHVRHLDGMSNQFH